MSTNQLMRSDIPSKGQVNRAKVRKGYNGHRQLTAVGGYKNPYLAIFAPADAELCHVVPEETGMRDGKPFRNVGTRYGR